MLILADQFLSIFRHARSVWISGMFGKHKTSFAYALAEIYLKRGYRLITNNKSVWGDKMNEIDFLEDGTLKVVVILDEAGLDVKFRSQAEQMTAYLRKMDVYIIMPSFWPPSQMLRFLTLQPTINWQMIGLPLINYKWMVRLKMFEASGWFIWTNPERVYGIYSSLDPGNEAQIVLDWLTQKATEYRAKFGYAPENEVPGLAPDPLSEAAEEFAEAADVISISLGKAPKRFRR